MAKTKTSKKPATPKLSKGQPLSKGQQKPVAKKSAASGRKDAAVKMQTPKGLIEV
jgi:hypothetical protein